MRKFFSIAGIVMLAFALSHASSAQDTAKTEEAQTSSEPAPHFYHLVFVVQELGADHKPVNSRTYTTTVSTDRHFTGSIRTGSRIPIATGASANPKVITDFQYIDDGINFDILHVVENGRQLSLDLSAEISSVAEALDPNVHQPVIRQNRWKAALLLPLGKETTIFTSDSLDNSGSMQVLATATPAP